MTKNPVFSVSGRCSWFGGPNDSGVTVDEGLALISGPLALHPLHRRLFIKGLDVSKGLARQLDPEQFYCACRWDYGVLSALVLRRAAAKITTATGLVAWAALVDWGPNVKTGRVVDMSQGMLNALMLSTDDVVTVEIFV